MNKSSNFKSAVTRAPMLRATIFFVGGLLLGRAIALPINIALVLAVAFFLCWIAASYLSHEYHQRWWRGAMFMPLMLAFGLLWQRIHSSDARPDDISRFGRDVPAWRVRLIEITSSHDRTVRAWADVDAAMPDEQLKPASGRVLLTLLKDSTSEAPEVGDRLLITARCDTIDRIPDPGGFDLRAWGGTYGATHECFAPKDHWVVLDHATGFDSFFDDARDRIVEWLKRSGLADRERAMVKAILLGVRDELDQDQKDAFVRSGTMHVLAVSGSHVGLIYVVFLGGLGFLGQRKRSLVFRGVVILFALWAYAGLTGFTPSVLRATLTFSLFTIADMTRYRVEPLNSLAGAAFMLLLWDPTMLVQLSFQLSFLAVFGIALFYKPIMMLWAAPNKPLHYFWSLVAVSLSAQTFTLPISLLAFKAFPIWFLPANMVIVGLVSIGVYGGALLLMLHAVPILGPAITWLMEGLLRFLGWFSDFFAYLPGAYPDVRINAWQCIGLYALVLLLTAWIMEKWHWARTGAVMMTLALLLSWGWSAHARNAQHHLVIYDDRDKLTCAVIDGRAMTVFTDTVDHWTARKIEKHRRDAGAFAVRTNTAMPERIRNAGEDVLIIDPQYTANKSEWSFPPLAVVLKDDGRYEMDTLNARIHPLEGFVLSPTISAKHRSYIRHWCAEHHVRVYDVRNDGAYVR